MLEIKFIPYPHLVKASNCPSNMDSLVKNNLVEFDHWVQGTKNLLVSPAVVWCSLVVFDFNSNLVKEQKLKIIELLEKESGGSPAYFTYGGMEVEMMLRDINLVGDFNERLHTILTFEDLAKTI